MKLSIFIMAIIAMALSIECKKKKKGKKSVTPPPAY